MVINMRFIVLASILIFPINVLACSCDRTATDKSRFEEAGTVVLAEVTNTRLIKTTYDSEEMEIIEAEFEPIEVFKHGAEKANFVRGASFGFGNCNIGLMSGLEYIFYIPENRDDVDEQFKNFVHMCDGSNAVNVHKNDFEEDLEKLRSFGKNETP